MTAFNESYDSEEDAEVEEGLLGSIGNAVKGAVKGFFEEDVDEDSEDAELFKCDMNEGDCCNENDCEPIDEIFGKIPSWLEPGVSVLVKKGVKSLDG